ncbi:unnamed protein product, partial [Prorocentrum cordatum]
RARRASSGSRLYRCSERCGKRSWIPTSSPLALGSARARKAGSGSRVFRCSARCGRRRWSRTPLSVTPRVSALARRTSSG